MRADNTKYMSELSGYGTWVQENQEDNFENSGLYFKIAVNVNDLVLII